MFLFYDTSVSRCKCRFFKNVYQLDERFNTINVFAIMTSAFDEILAFYCCFSKTPQRFSKDTSVFFLKVVDKLAEGDIQVRTVTFGVDQVNIKYICTGGSGTATFTELFSLHVN